MAKEVNLYIRYDKTLKSGTVNVSHELALKYELQVGSELTIRLDDDMSPNETIQRIVKVDAVKTLRDGAHIESSNVECQTDNRLKAYIVEL